VEHLLGQVNFIIYINPSDTEFIEYKKYLQNIANDSLPK